MPQTDAARYIARILELYRQTPGTSGRVRPADRRLAATLASRHVPLGIVETALLLAVARRSFRPTGAVPLPAIASLHYFMPLVDELLAAPPDTTYLDHLRQRLAPLAPRLVALVDHRLT